MKSVSCECGDPHPETDDAGARKRAAVEIYARNEAALRRTARRFSLCEDDADEALQRGLEILLRKAPSTDARELVKWTQTVVRHEASTIRRERERLLPRPGTKVEEDWVSLLPSRAAGPPERAERREAVARSREALQALKPQELRALTLLAEGYSYAEIGEITSWSQTKVNRCIAEGRERFRSLVSRSRDGSRCLEMRPLISAFCDGEAGAEEVATVREHLRACAGCRATVRTYRAAPGAAAALVPLLPLQRSLLERAREALSDLAGRFGGGKADAVSHVASGGGGIGAAGLVKAAAICIATAGGTAACVDAGLVPAPLGAGGSQSQSQRPRQRPRPAPRLVEAVEYEADPLAMPQAEPEPKPGRSKRQEGPEAEAAPAQAEPAAAVSEPSSASGAVEYAPPPEPESAPEPVSAPAQSAASGSPAGEFGP